MVPNFLTNELKPLGTGTNTTATSTYNATFYVLKSLNLGTQETQFLVLVNVLVYAIVGKLIPCCLMGIFGTMLVYQMQMHVQKRRRIIMTFSEASGMKFREHSRTTVMLISVIILFVVAEFPQGVLIMISACKRRFFDTVYLPLGDVMDIVALLNNAINFVLYCTMSAKFRETFIMLFCSLPKCWQKCLGERSIMYM
ncbi:hypothetical protein SNE40_015646 [Patella caerulea]|uniref:G-protein coupled receptors family 1 profile domain-containing protein n=1 Tax=Patella caerulea TaxID=87958 RepID=A0AAN8JG50_PATCE